MAKVNKYHRPQTIDETVILLRESGTAVLAGGTQLIPNSQEIGAIVDLQSVGLNQIEREADTVTFGAMIRLQEIVDHLDVPELIRQMAHREGSNTFRNVGTIGGVIALADWESELYAALLLFEAAVTTQSATGEQRYQLSESWHLSEGELITAVTIQTTGITASERVARTPADKPIVAVLGRQTEKGTLLAACGLADKPILITESDLDSLRPPADFRGSAVYRQEMAKVLTNRVRRRIQSQIR
ncbi:MAG: hypothetical protein GY796_30475 [Chloroflexi bacterium]|nr:hypothetical protein [Chloroflexota bacterium]